MKPNNPYALLSTSGAILVLAAIPLARGQDTVVTESTASGKTTVTTETTSSEGTITSFSPNVIIIRTDKAPQPVQYSYTKTTRYIDENGQPVSVEHIKEGRNATVYYVKDGDRLVAQRVVVRGPARPSLPTIVGMTTTITPDSFVVQGRTDGKPLRYTYTKSTQYVNDAGESVTVKEITSGKPVTVHYVKEGDRLVAQRVIVHKVLPEPQPVVVEKKTTTTTTTTEQPKRDDDDDDGDDDDDDNNS